MLSSYKEPMCMKLQTARNLQEPGGLIKSKQADQINSEFGGRDQFIR